LGHQDKVVISKKENIANTIKLFNEKMEDFKLSVKEEIHAFCEKMNADPGYMDGRDFVFQVNLMESGPIQMQIKESRITVFEENPHPPDMTLIISDDNYSKLLKNELNSTMAFMTGKIKVQGKLDLAFKLLEIVKEYQ